MREIKPGTFFEADDFTVTAFRVTHKGPDCFGYIFETKARRPFLAEKAVFVMTDDGGGKPAHGRRCGSGSPKKKNFEHVLSLIKEYCFFTQSISIE